MQLPGLWLELGKARLSALVVATAAVGFLVGAPHPLDLGAFLAVSLGTFLLALGANAFNQWIEADRDARMERTCDRPLPSGRLSRPHAFAAASAFVLLGAALLAAWTNPLTTALGLLNVAIYTLAYTPLKVVSPVNTLVGALCGAIPPLMGWAAATGALAPGAFILAAVLFVWQIPHSLALAVMYRDDYARGGYRMLPVLGDRLTFHMVNLYCLALIPVALAATVAGIAGWIYATGAVLLGGGMSWAGLALWRRRGRAEARRLFFATLLYLPLLLGLLVADHVSPPAVLSIAFGP